MTDEVDRPAFYALSTGTGGLRDWITLLHPPYTAWHLSYVAVGAALAPRFEAWRLGGTLLAFFLAVGLGAHALDELAGRPLRTGIPSPALAGTAVVSVAAPVVVGLEYGGWRLLPFVVLGAFLVVVYNLELLGGTLHNGATFALGWGAFPLVTGYYAQDFRLGWAVVPAAAAAALLSLGQRAMSLQVRALRRRTRSVGGTWVHADGAETALDRAVLMTPLERGLRAEAYGLVLLAVAMVAARW
jgi:hypothetical protein